MLVDDLWQFALQLDPSLLSAREIDSDDLHNTLLDGAFMLPPLDQEEGFRPQPHKVHTYSIARCIQDPKFLETVKNTSEDPRGDVETHFCSLVEQPAKAVFSLLAEGQDEPPWTRLGGFSNRFKNLGTLTATQLRQVRSALSDLTGKINQFYKILDGVAIGNYDTILLNPARVRTARHVQELTKLSNELLDDYLPNLLTVDAVASFARLLADLFLSHHAEDVKLKGYATELQNIHMPDDHQLDSSLDFLNISPTFATKGKAKLLLQSLGQVKEKIALSIAHTKAATGQSIVEAFARTSRVQARSFTIGLGFSQILQHSASWTFRRHLCHYYDTQFRDTIADTLMSFAEISTFGPNEPVEIAFYSNLIKTKAKEFSPYLGSDSASLIDPMPARNNDASNSRISLLQLHDQSDDELILRQLAELRAMRDKVVGHLTTVNVATPTEKDKIALRQARLHITHARDMVHKLTYINSIKTSSAHRNEYMSISSQLNDLEIEHDPAIGLALEEIKKVETNLALHHEIELKNRKKINFMWDLGDQARLPLFKKHVDTHYSSLLYPDEEARLRAIRSVIRPNNNYPQLNTLLMHHNKADDFLRVIYDSCSDPHNLCEETHRALESLKSPRDESSQLRNIGSIQAIRRHIPGALQDTVFTTMTIRKLLHSAFDTKTRDTFVARVADLDFAKRAKIAEARPGEFIQAADYRLQDDKYRHEFWDFLDKMVLRLATHSNLSHSLPKTEDPPNKFSPSPPYSPYQQQQQHPGLRLNQGQFQGGGYPPPKCLFSDCRGNHFTRYCPTLAPVPPRNISALLAKDTICVRCLDVKMSEQPTHRCGGSFQLLSKDTGKYREQITDCHRRCQQDGVNMNHRVCLVCIEIKSKLKQASGKGAAPDPTRRTVSNQLGLGGGEGAQLEELGDQFQDFSALQDDSYWSPHLSFFSNQIQTGQSPIPRPGTPHPSPLHTPDTPEPIPQLAPGSGSQLLENIEVLDENGIWIKVRALHDSGADLTAVDTAFADGLGIRPLASSRDFSVTTIHGTSGIASEYTLTIRMPGAPRTAKFLGVTKMAKFYPGHRLQLQEKFLRMFRLKKEHLYQEAGIVNLLIGSNSSSLFPTILYQQDNVIFARSKFTGKLLVQGAIKLPNLANHHLAAQALRLCGLKLHESPTTDPRVAPPRAHRRR